MDFVVELLRFRDPASPVAYESVFAFRLLRTKRLKSVKNDDLLRLPYLSTVLARRTRRFDSAHAAFALR